MQAFEYPYDTFEILTGSSLPSVHNFTAEVCRQYFGILKVFVVPPLRLLHPVLPFKSEQTGILEFFLLKFSKLISKIFYRSLIVSTLSYLRYKNGNKFFQLVVNYHLR